MIKSSAVLAIRTASYEGKRARSCQGRHCQPAVGLSCTPGTAPGRSSGTSQELTSCLACESLLQITLLIAQEICVCGLDHKMIWARSSEGVESWPHLCRSYEEGVSKASCPRNGQGLSWTSCWWASLGVVSKPVATLHNLRWVNLSF